MKVNLRFEVQGYRGDITALYKKEIEMSAAPTVGLNITQQDIVLTIDRLQYDLDDDTYYALIIEQESGESWDFLTDEKHNWSKD